MMTLKVTNRDQHRMALDPIVLVNTAVSALSTKWCPTLWRLHFQNVLNLHLQDTLLHIAHLKLHASDLGWNACIPIW